jgi:acetoin utilization protein AcuB
LTRSIQAGHEETSLQSKVKSYMTGRPISIVPDASAIEAFDLMIEHGIRHLPVLDGRGRVCGVLSFDDLRAALPVALSLSVPLEVAERRSLLDTPVGDVMTYSPATVRSDTPLEEAAELMADRRIGCLPVVDAQGAIEGILSETDLLHALITVLWSRRRQGRDSAVVDLVGAFEAERAHLLEQLDAYERREQASTEIRHDTPLDLAEQGSLADDDRLTEALAEMASRRLRVLEHALERQRKGELGVCEACGGQIPEARLRAMPGSTTCIRCARQATEPS